MASSRSSSDYSLSSVTAALKLVEQFTAEDRITVASAAATLGVGRSSAHRLLRTLEARNFALLSSSGRGYTPGPALLALSCAPSVTADTRIRIRPIIEETQSQLGESVHSAILAGDHVMVVDGRRSTHGRDIGLRTGMTAPAHSMAAGKLLLAALDDTQVRALLPPEPLARRGPGTIISHRELLAELAWIRRHGWAETHDESEADVHSVAVPLDGNDWRTRMALIISLPHPRADEDLLIELASSARQIVARYAEQGVVSPWPFEPSPSR